MSGKPSTGKAGWLQNARDALFKLEVIYLAVLPFLGAFSIYALGNDRFTYVVMAGWLLALMNIYIHVPLYLDRGHAKGARILIPLIPMAAAAGSQGLRTGDLWGYFLDNSVMEAGALMAGFAWMFMFGKGISGNSAKKDLGIGLVVIVVGLFVGSAGGFFLAWADRWPHGQVVPIGMLLFGLGMAIYHKVRLIQRLVEGGFSPDSYFDDRMWLIIGPIFAWLALLPLAAWLFSLATA